MKKLVIVLSFFFALFFLSCSKKTSRSLFEEALNHIEKGHYLKALDCYKKIVNDFKNDSLASTALFEIAKMYQSKLFNDIDEKKSFEYAVEFYSLILSNYPASKEEPFALFMIGYIENNYLNNYEKAKEAYEKFLNKYPQHELSLSAKVELENIGKPPEEILKSISLSNEK
jgi:TolA-binding protein